MKKWKKVCRDNPPMDEDFWGFNDFDESVWPCIWDGENTNDDGNPFPLIPAQRGDDHCITYWMEMEEPPAPPNVKDYEEE